MPSPSRRPGRGPRPQPARRRGPGPESDSTQRRPGRVRPDSRRSIPASLSAPPPLPPPPPHDPGPIVRAGLVAFIGRTNVGKSSLINALVGSKVSIVTPKPQTTRHPVHGVLARSGSQIVLVDTPGFFETHKSRLVDRLHERARAALEGIDAVVHVVDPSRPPGAEDQMVLAALKPLTQPRILCLNKSDLRHRPHREAWLGRRADYTGVLEVSARTGAGLGALLDALAPLVPEGPALYPPGEVTNVQREFRIAELIREKVYLLTHDEVPYRTAIELDLVEDRVGRDGEPFIHVKAAILVAVERYKGMLIGAGGSRIRDIGIAARRDLEPLLGRQVFLDLAVIVDPKLDP
ncbi:MAG: GTPase Era [Limisphaerales bacterium]